MLKVLFVEDDLMIGKTTFQLLMHENYEVDWARTGLEALDYLFKQTYHLILLDLGLPELEGLDVLKHIRHKAEFNKMGIIIISARDQTTDKIQGLRLGADDYLVKPFDFDELLARMEVIIRRSANYSHQEVSFSVGDLVMYPSTHRLLKANEPVVLSMKEWTILEPLMMYPNQIFSREMLEQKLYNWNDDVQSNTIEVHIHNLRVKLGKTTIRTVRGLGYCMGSLNQSE
ncbi:response regulator transcription factor [Acinetobacter nectaris]|uniref:response regulator transcription factor n=1 Tax=Acinetobacter nectaris TaxID=1219382 RepID=UPI001F45B5C9|nr:response regulator transcription factor [Acinetobacter nectaris]